MSLPSEIEKLSDVAAGRCVLLCDAWGVIHDGVTLFEGAKEALLGFRRASGPVVIITNAPRPASVILPQLDRLGLPREAYDAVATSGEAARAEIAARSPLPAFFIGAAADDSLFAGLGVDFASLADAGFIVCTGLDPRIGAEPESHRSLLEIAASRGLPMICANPDIIVRWGGRLVYCAGAIAAIYADMGGEIVYCGKPHDPIYRLALDAAEQAAGGAIDKACVLAVGDGLDTDIAGANAIGVDAIYIYGEAGVHAGSANPAAILDMLAKRQRRAAIMEKLRW